MLYLQVCATLTLVWKRVDGGNPHHSLDTSLEKQNTLACFSVLCTVTIFYTILQVQCVSMFSSNVCGITFVFEEASVGLKGSLSWIVVHPWQSPKHQGHWAITEVVAQTHCPKNWEYVALHPARPATVQKIPGPYEAKLHNSTPSFSQILINCPKL